jgi:hypothetical protein
LDRALDAIEEIHLEESRRQEKYYTKLPPSMYGALDYMDKVYEVTRKHRSWIIRDFSEKNIVRWIIGTLLTIAGIAVALFLDWT